MSRQSIANNLRFVKAHLETYGWIQGDLGEAEHPTCLLGAISVASNSCEEELAVSNFVSAVAGFKYAYMIAGWNDSPKRTAEDVLALVDRAIIAASGDTNV